MCRFDLSTTWLLILGRMIWKKTRILRPELRLRQSLEHAQNRATEVEIRTFWIFSKWCWWDLVDLPRLSFATFQKFKKCCGRSLNLHCFDNYQYCLNLTCVLILSTYLSARFWKSQKACGLSWVITQNMSKSCDWNWDRHDYKYFQYVAGGSCYIYLDCCQQYFENVKNIADEV